MDLLPIDTEAQRLEIYKKCLFLVEQGHEFICYLLPTIRGYKSIKDFNFRDTVTHFPELKNFIEYKPIEHFLAPEPPEIHMYRTEWTYDRQNWRKLVLRDIIESLALDLYFEDNKDKFN